MGGLRSLTKPVFAASDRILRPPRGPRLLIYHQVGAGHGKQIDVTLDNFRWQVEWLLNNRVVVDLDTAIKRLNEPTSDRFVALTFDDGYLDTFTTAFPVLKAHGLPFTIYIATSFIGDDSSCHDRLTWGQLSEMLASGLVTVGAHTDSHADLRTLEEDQVADEIRTSNELIESRLGVRPRHFAYPWGYWGSTADEIVRREYTSAALGSARVRTSSALDLHQLHRFPIQLSDGRRWFVKRLVGGLLVEEELRRRIRNYRGP